MEKSERLKELDKEIERLKKEIEEKKERKNEPNSKCIYDDELIEYGFNEFSIFYE